MVLNSFNPSRLGPLFLQILDIFQAFFRTFIFIDFCRFWDTFGHPFSIILALFVHPFSDLDFVSFFYCSLESFWHHFPTLFLMFFQHLAKLADFVKIAVLLQENKVLSGSVSSHFQVFSIFVRHIRGIEFWTDFVLMLEAFLVNFSDLFDIMFDSFSVLFC